MQEEEAEAQGAAVIRRLGALAFGCAVLLLPAGNAVGLPAKTYVGPNGGDWNVATNWSPEGIPNAENEVLISSKTVIVRDADAIAGAITSFADSRIEVRGVRLTLADAGANPVNGLAAVQGGLIAVEGSAHLPAVELGETGKPASTGTLLVAGSVTIGSIVERSAGAGLFRIAPAGEVVVPEFGGGHIETRFENDGVFGTETTVFAYLPPGSPSSDGSFILNSVGSQARLIVDMRAGGSFPLGPDSSLTGDGTLTVQGTSGTVQVDAGAEFAPRKLEIFRPVLLELDADGTVEEFATVGGVVPPFDRGGRGGTGTLTVTGPPTSSLVSPRFQDAGTTSFTGPVTLAGGTSGAAVVNGARFVTRGATTFSGGDVYLGNPGGSGVWENGGALSISGRFIEDRGGGLLRNLPGATLVATEHLGGSVSVENAGALTINRNFGTPTLGAYGTLVQTGGSITVASPGTLNKRVTLQGGTLSGTGSVRSLDNVAGVVEPGSSVGTLTIVESFGQGAGGTLRAEIDSAAAFDRLTVGGSATLGGTLALAGHPLFAPELDDEFPVLSAASRIGQFASVTGAAAGVRRYVPEYSATGVSLCVVEGAGACGVAGPIAAPSNVTASNATQSSFTVSWTPSPDGRVTRYAVSVDGAPRGETALTSLLVDGLLCGTAYGVEVRALDASGNASDPASAALSTAPCPLAPPSGLVVRERTETSLMLVWTASPDPRVTRYRVAVDGAVVGETGQTELLVQGLSCGTTYEAAVRGLDAGVGVSTPITAELATSACSLEPPTQLTAADVTQSTLTLSWTASPNPRVVKYAVFRDQELLGEVAGTSFAVAGLSCGTTYPFAVRARDAVGVGSAAVTLAVTTAACPPAPEPVPPPAPDPPRNVTQPQIVQEPNDNYRCNPGVWTGLATAKPLAAQQQLLFDFTWIKTTGEKVEPIAQTPLIKVTNLSIQSRYMCMVQPRVITGPIIQAESNPALLGGDIKLILPPPFGNFRVKGIDVFQVVQPNSGAPHWAPGEGAFPAFPGGGTPTAYRRLPPLFALLPDGDPQRIWYDGVPLDATKPTTAVVYVDWTPPPKIGTAQPLEVKLTALRRNQVVGSLRQPVTWLSAATRPYVTAAERDSPTSGIQFEVPSWWLHGGDIDLRADVYFQSYRTRALTRQCDPDPCTKDDTFRVDEIPIRLMPRLELATVELRSGGGPMPAPEGLFATARTVLPGGERLRIRPYAAVLDISFEAGLTMNDWECYKRGATDDDHCKSAHISLRLGQWYWDNPGSNHHILVGVHRYNVAPGKPEPGWSVREHCCLPKNDGNTADPIIAINDGSTTNGFTPAHELGHTFTAPHAGVACGGNSGSQKGEAWPTDGRGRLQGVKFERTGVAPYDPVIDEFTTMPDNSKAEIYDFMSYCDGTEWISPFNWNRFFWVLNDFKPYAPEGLHPFAAGPEPAQARNALVVGSLGPGGGGIERVSPPDGADRVMFSDPASPTRLRALDGAGKTISEVGVTVAGTSEDEGTEAGMFFGQVPAGAAAVELVHHGVLLDRFVRSRPPQVRLTSPAAGARVRTGGKLPVRWSATDPDRDTLEATVDFSADGGRTWRTVAEGPSRGQASVPSRYLQGTERARIRLSVNDGFNEASAVSTVFRVEGAPPHARIERPVSGETLVAPAPLHLRADARDDAGRPLRGKALRWYAGSRFLGSGERLRTRSLRGGRTTIRLVARDRHGRTSTARVRVRVRTPAPVVDALAGDRVVGPGARTTTLRIATSASAVLTIGGKRFAVGPKARAIVLRLPTRPKTGLLTLPFRLRNADGSSRGAIEIVRTA